MSFLLKGLIKLYWKFIPLHKRRPCVFNETCSNYVYRTTKEQGFIKGLLAFNERIDQCRPGYKLIKDEKNNSYQLYLKDGSIIKDDNISPTLLPTSIEINTIKE